MTPEEEITRINKTLEAIQNGWPFFLAELNRQITEKTEALINNDNEQTRGAIKALRMLKELPETLIHERDGWAAALAEQAAAD